MNNNNMEIEDIDDDNAATIDSYYKSRIYKHVNGDIIDLGWYPITHLEKYVTLKKKSWWKRLLFL
jgi:hypothetical protein